MTATPASTDIVLAPSYRIPLGLMALALPLIFVQLWLASLVGLFGGFLLVQALTLTLHFTDQALDIYRGKTLIRRFPYADWQHWEIFWAPVPILLYFREVNSIHFLPILFSPEQLRTSLETHCAKSAAEG
ncbi:MAG: DUF3119 family protein [Nodosilinea sp.]